MNKYSYSRYIYIYIIENKFLDHLNLSGQHKRRETETLREMAEPLDENRKNVYTL